MSNDTIVVVSGGFDPIHSGHIEYLKAAKALGVILVVGVNSDEWLARKKGKPFMNLSERKGVIEHLEMVDIVLTFNDDDDSARDLIAKTLRMFPENDVIFGNGGDRKSHNIPEMSLEDSRLSFAFGVGGDDKLNSSSWIIQNAACYTESRVWGSFSNLFQDDVVKVKELIIEPGKGISYQRHFKRSEIWFVSKGMVNVKHSISQPDEFVIHTLNADDQIHIKQGQWHQAFNPFDEPVHIIEIQYGDETSEDDIERLEYYNGE